MSSNLTQKQEEVMGLGLNLLRERGSKKPRKAWWELCKRAKRMYMDLRSVYTPSYRWSDSRCLTPIFKAVLAALNLEMPPEKYISLVFDFSAPSYPKPFELVTGHLLRKIQVYHKPTSQRLQQALACELSAFNIELGFDRSPEEVLEDDSLEIGPLVRCCLAERYGLDKLSRRYADAAATAVCNEPVYKELLGESLPEFLR